MLTKLYQRLLNKEDCAGFSGGYHSALVISSLVGYQLQLNVEIIVDRFVAEGIKEGCRAECDVVLSPVKPHFTIRFQCYPVLFHPYRKRYRIGNAFDAHVARH